MTRSIRVGSLEQFISAVARVRTAWTSATGKFFEPWFRGQSNINWMLVPGLFRSGTAPYENEIRSQFASRGAQLIGGRSPQSEWEWYFLMQHYRVPTRLLDWSDGSLIALFFALNSNSPDSIRVRVDPVVWMLDPWWLNRTVLGRNSVILSTWEQAKDYLPPLFGGDVSATLPIAIDPQHVAERLRVQRSHFTVHGTDPHGLEAAAKVPDARLIPIRIARGVVDKMRLELATCGIVDSVIFPDLEGISAEIARYFNGVWYR